MEDDRFFRHVDALKGQRQIIGGTPADIEVKLAVRFNMPRYVVTDVGVGQELITPVVENTCAPLVVLVEEDEIVLVRQARQGELILSIRSGNVECYVTVDKGRVGINAEALEATGEEVHQGHLPAIDIGIIRVRGLLDEKLGQWIAWLRGYVVRGGYVG